MRFLADENFPGAAIASLIARGHDVAWVRTSSPGASDRDVFMQAVRESRILLTFDKDFGEIARTSALPVGCGVVLFRLPMPKAREAGERLAAIVHGRSDWAGCFSVVDSNRVRMRPLS